MLGTVAKFSLDLLSIPCFLPAKGNDKHVIFDLNLNGLSVAVTLFSEESPSRTEGSTGLRRFFYNRIIVTVLKADEDLRASDFVEGRARILLMEFQLVVLEVINRLVCYFKYELRHPNLRELNYVDFLNQEHEFCNPVWETSEGVNIVVSDKTISSGVFSIPGVGFLQDDLFGIVAFTADNSKHLQKFIASTDHRVPLAAQLLSDAQSAALSGNVRRAVLEPVQNLLRLLHRVCKLGG
ncbi:hypothetical protein ACU4GI_20525 [Cupriavidus basilensis]